MYKPELQTPEWANVQMHKAEILKIYEADEPEQRQGSLQIVDTHSGSFKVASDKAITAPSETASQALSVIENLELLGDLLADEAIAVEIVDLLHEPTRGEQLFRVSRSLHALNDLRRSIENHRSS